MPITFYEVNLLPQHQQAEYLWEEGKFVAERLEEIVLILLYQLHSFYVEVYYHKEINDIQKLRSFSSTDQLKPYLDKNDISKIE